MARAPRALHWVAIDSTRDDRFFPSHAYRPTLASHWRQRCKTGLALSQPKQKFWATVRRFAFALVPLGLAMWIAHLLKFHFAMGWDSIGPIRAFAVFAGLLCRAKAADFSSPLMSADLLLKLQASMLGIGLLATLYAGWRIASPAVRRLSRTSCYSLRRGAWPA